MVSILQNFFRLSPGFCFADGLASLALLRQGMKDKSSDGAFDWNVTGASICYLGSEVHVFSQFFFFFCETILQLSIPTILYVEILEWKVYWMSMMLMSSSIFFSK